MDTEAVERLGSRPAAFFLEALDPGRHSMTREQVFRYMGFLRQQMGLTSVFELTVGLNRSDSAQSLLRLGLGGTTFPFLSYYDGPGNISDQLVDGIGAMLQLVGDSPDHARLQAARIVGFEAGLLRVMYGLPPAGRAQQSTQELDNWSLEQLAELMPDVPFQAYVNSTGLRAILDEAGVPGYAELEVFPPQLVELNKFLAAVEPATLQMYARWHALNMSTPYLALKFRATHALHFGSLVGNTAVLDRTPLCLSSVVINLADLFGRYFMARRLQPEMKQQATELITWILQAFERTLPSLDWMDERTRVLALEKANAVLELVGGPDVKEWSDYSQILIRRGQYYENWYQLLGLRTLEQWTQLTMPVPRGRFSLNPSLVNAYYNQRQNAMIFPAGILVKPFFNYDAPMAMNLGGIGMIMGHELVHAFDNFGRRFDKDGVLRQWWDDAVIEAFNNKTKCLIDQYNNITVQGYYVNGQLTLGENIADNGGLHLAYLALQRYVERLSDWNLQDPVPPSRNPLTTNQLFYWAHAQSFCTKATDALIELQVRYDVHSPGEARVWAPLVNQAGFAQAFRCPVGSRMNPAASTKCDLYSGTPNTPPAPEPASSSSSSSTAGARAAPPSSSSARPVRCQGWAVGSFEPSCRCPDGGRYPRSCWCSDMSDDVHPYCSDQYSASTGSAGQGSAAGPSGALIAAAVIGLLTIAGAAFYIYLRCFRAKARSNYAAGASASHAASLLGRSSDAVDNYDAQVDISGVNQLDRPKEIRSTSLAQMV